MTLDVAIIKPTIKATFKSNITSSTKIIVHRRLMSISMSMSTIMQMLLFLTLCCQFPACISSFTFTNLHIHTTYTHTTHTYNLQSPLHSPSLPYLHKHKHKHKHIHKHIHIHKRQQSKAITSSLLQSSSSSLSSTTSLSAISKSQTVIYDGAEFLSILSYLCSEDNPRLGLAIDNTNSSSNSNTDSNSKDDEISEITFIENTLPSKKAGFLKFVIGTINNNNNNNNKQKVIGVAYPYPYSYSYSSTTNDNDDNPKWLTRLDDDVYVYTDSIATIPKNGNGNSINDDDVISTASAALCGVHCGNPTSNSSSSSSSSNSNGDGKKAKTVVLGGGDYACFTAKALSSFGHDVYLVTTRPMSLKDTPLNPLRDSNVNAMAPTTTKLIQVQQNDEEDTKEYEETTIGFSEALGQFDSCIDTLGDEANFKNVKFVQDGINRFCGTAGVIAKLALENQCQKYVSTVTRSQRFVLEEGILFARDPVLNYQKMIENDPEILSTTTSSSSASSSASSAASSSSENYQLLPPPRNFGKTLQSLLDNRIIYPTDRNENGNHGRKQAFVRGCSFPDYAEIEIWPQDSTEGAAVRFGFPGIRELTLEARMDSMIGSFDTTASKSANANNSSSRNTADSDTSEEDQPKKKRKKIENPFVIDIESLNDISIEIRNAKKDAILFISAPYCRLCRTIGPQFNRMARLSKEELNSDLQFAKATTGTSKAMKQLTFTLQIDSVPTFVLFRKGERYGEPIGVTKLPSVKLNRAIEGLKTGKDWDPEILDIKEGGTKMRTKI